MSSTIEVTSPEADRLPTDVWFANSLMRVLADAEVTGGQLALIEQRAPRGFSPPTHVHSREDQLLVVIEGAITARLGDDDSVVGEGESVWLPRGIAHTFRVDSDEARIIEVTTPGGFEQFHVELGTPATEVRIPDPAPVDVGAMAAGSVP